MSATSRRTVFASWLGITLERELAPATSRGTVFALWRELTHEREQAKTLGRQRTGVGSRRRA